MLNLDFEITNPFVKADWSGISSVFNYSKQVTEFKAFEIAILRMPSLMLGLQFQIRTNVDHPGFNWSIALFGIELNFNFYDVRHRHATADDYYK